MEMVKQLFFEHFVRFFSVPKNVVYDRDPHFTFAFWKAFGSKSIASSSCHPQTDGQTERMHRTLEQAINTHVLESGDERSWLSSLPFVEFAINSAGLDSTGVAPFKLVQGAMLAVPVDRLDGLHRVETAQGFIQILQDDIRASRKKLEQAQAQQKCYYNSRRRDIRFDIVR